MNTAILLVVPKSTTRARKELPLLVIPSWPHSEPCPIGKRHMKSRWKMLILMNTVILSLVLHRMSRSCHCVGTETRFLPREIFSTRPWREKTSYCPSGRRMACQTRKRWTGKRRKNTHSRMFSMIRIGASIMCSTKITKGPRMGSI